MKKRWLFWVLACLMLGLTGQGHMATVIAQELATVEIGPGGYQAATPAVLELTDADKATLKANVDKYTAAIVMHYLESDWSKLQVQGMLSVFKEYGINVISVTGAEYRLDEHIMNMERAISKKPDVILSIVVNEEAEGPVYQTVSENGIHLILLDMLPKGLQHPQHYDTLIAATNRGNGAIAADIMGEQLNGKGKVGILKLAFPHFVTEQRMIGFEERLREKYPEIEVVERVGFGGEAVTMEEAVLRTEELLKKHPDLNGLFAVWMDPAMAAAAAAKKMGRTPQDFVITTSDLEETGALEIARNGFVKGTGAQDPYAQGRHEALAAIKAILGHKLPPFIAVPGMKITRENLLEGYKQILQKDPPEEIKNAL